MIVEPRGLGYGLARRAVSFAGIAIILTVIMYGTGEREQVALTFLVNLFASAGIGSATEFVYRLGRRRGFTLPLGLHHVVFLSTGTVLGTEVALGLLSLVGTYDAWRLRLALWIIGGVVGCVSAVVSTLYNRLRDKARAEELRAEQSQRAAMRAELDALRARVQPHFLFNALNTVAALIEENQNPAAVEAVERLSNLMRYSLEGEAERTVPLREELRFVGDYLSLEALRFPSRLISSVDVDDTVRSGAVLVPRFVLQPSVENAVNHGVAATERPVTVTVAAGVTDSRLRLRVTDDGPGSNHTRGTKTSQAALRARLALMYGDAAAMSAGPRAGGGYEVEVTLPATAEEMEDV